MASCFSAILAAVEDRTGVDGRDRYLAFPSFIYMWNRTAMRFDAERVLAGQGVAPGTADPATRAQATLQASRNEALFAMLVNQIPNGTSEHEPGGDHMVWDLYEGMLAGAIKAPREDVALRFSELGSKLTLGAVPTHELASGRYFPTPPLPPSDVDDDRAWTRLSLDPGTFAGLDARLSAPARAWLEERGLAGEVFGDEVELHGGSIEVFHLPLRRVWLDLAVFGERTWRLQDAPLCDGERPPHGRMPAVIVGVVFARRMTLELQRRGGAGSSSDFAGRLHAFGARLASRVRSGHDEMARLARAGAAPPAAPESAAAASAARRDTFPIVPRIFARPVVEALLAEHASAASALAALDAAVAAGETELAEVVRDAAAEERNLAQLQARLEAALDEREPPRDFPRGGDEGSPRPGGGTINLGGIRTAITAARRKLDDLENRRQALEPQLAAQRADQAAASARKAELTTAIEELTDLGRVEEPADQMYVLGFVCEALPRCPDPDPSLF